MAPKWQLRRLFLWPRKPFKARDEANCLDSPLATAGAALQPIISEGLEAKRVG